MTALDCIAGLRLYHCGPSCGLVILSRATGAPGTRDVRVLGWGRERRDRARAQDLDGALRPMRFLVAAMPSVPGLNLC